MEENKKKGIEKEWDLRDVKVFSIWRGNSKGIFKRKKRPQCSHRSIQVVPSGKKRGSVGTEHTNADKSRWHDSASRKVTGRGNPRMGEGNHRANKRGVKAWGADRES